MSSRLVAQICRIVAPEKLPDYLLCTGVVGDSTQSKLSEQPVLAYMFEVTKPWLPSSQLFPALESILAEALTKISLGKNLDDQFEDLLKAVNQRLNAVSEHGETDWIGNLNGLIILIGNAELHFSQTGRCPTYLLQNNRIRQITEDPATDADPHPLKTFANLASGHLNPGDRVLIGNQELYNEISLDALRRILASTSPFIATQAIAKELKAEKNPKVITLIVSIAEEDAKLAHEPGTVNMELELESGFKKLQRRLQPVLIAAKKGSEKVALLTSKAAVEVGKASIKAAAQAQQITKEKVIPGTGALLAKGAQSFKDMGRVPVDPPQTTMPAVVEIILPASARNQAAPEPVEAVETVPEDMPIGAIIPVTGLNNPEPHKQHAQRTLPELLRYFFTKKLPYLALTGLHRALLWLQIPKNKKITALGLGIILIGATIWGAFGSHRAAGPSTSNSEVNKTIAEVQALDAKITTAIGLEQTVEASKEAAEALAKLDSLTNITAAQKRDVDQLWASISKKADTLSKTVRLTTATGSYPFTTSSLQGFISGLPYFYGWQAASGNLYRTGNGTLNQVQGSTALSNTADSVVSVAKSSETDTAGYALSKQSKVYRVVQIGAKTDLRAISPAKGDFAAGEIISSYLGNVYILDGKSGLLWRYANSGTSYAEGKMIIDVNKVNLRGSVSLAIDGSIFVLKNDGSVIHLISGKLDDGFSLKNQPYLASKFIQPLQISTPDGDNNLYILDGGTTTTDHSTARILQFSKSGEFIQQYAFPADVIGVKAFEINPKDKKIWLLYGNKIAEFSL